MKTECQKAQESMTISCLMSTLMSVAALVYMFVMGMYSDGHPEKVSWFMMTPAIALLAGAMYVLVKPAKVEW